MMFLSIHVIRYIIELVSLFMAYAIIITPTGYFYAWVAKKMGDATPEHCGLLSFNPLNHIDPLGSILLILTKLGWQRSVPINVLNIQGKYRKLKLGCVFFSKSFMYLVLFVLFSLITTFAVIPTMTLYASSFVLAIAQLFYAAIPLSFFFSLLYFIYGLAQLVSVQVGERYPEYEYLAFYLVLLAPFLFVLLSS